MLGVLYGAWWSSVCTSGNLSVCLSLGRGHGTPRIQFSEVFVVSVQSAFARLRHTRILCVLLIDVIKKNHSRADIALVLRFHFPSVDGRAGPLLFEKVGPLGGAQFLLEGILSGCGRYKCVLVSVAFDIVNESFRWGLRRPCSCRLRAEYTFSGC